MSKVEQMRQLRETAWLNGKKTQPRVVPVRNSVSSPPVEEKKAAETSGAAVFRVGFVPDGETEQQPTTARKDECAAAQETSNAETSKPVDVLVAQTGALSETPGAVVSDTEVMPGKPIGGYSDAELLLVVREAVAAEGSAELERVIPGVMQRLGFVRRGKIICQRVAAALGVAD